MLTTAKQRLRYPVGGDTPNVPRDIGNLAADLETILLREDMEAVDRWRPGRQVFTNFSQSTVDALKFDMTGHAYISDGGVPAIQPTGNGVDMIVTTKQSGWRNVEGKMRFRWATSPPHSSSLTRLLGRYLDSSNFWYAYMQHNTAIGGVGGVSVNNATETSNGVGGVTSSDSASASRNVDYTTAVRLLRFRILENVMYVKTWLEASAEPDWQVIVPLGHSNGNMEMGACGVWGKGFNGTANNIIIYEMAFTELLRVNDNLLANSEGVHRLGGLNNDNTVAENAPIAWKRPDGAAAPSGGNLVRMVSDVDPFGETRDVFRVLNAPGGAGGGGFYQDMMDVGHVGKSIGGTDRPGFNVDFDRQALEFSVWTKGIAIDPNPSASIGSAVIVFYIYDINNNILQGFTTGPVTPVTFRGMGPLSVPGPLAGTGTWDWYKTRMRMNWPGSARGRIWKYSLRMIFHDGTGPAGGEFRFCHPRLRLIG